MKKLLSMLAITLAVFASCSSNDDSNDGDVNPPKDNKTYKLHDNNIVGVWRKGSDCFVSFSSEKFNSSLLNDKFVDEGDYTIKNDTVFVKNNYFNKTTKYVVNSISDKVLNVTVTYDDRWNGKKTVNMQFEKAQDTPCSKTHNLVGKSFYAQYSVGSGSQHWNKTFTTYNTMSCTRQDVASSTPSTFYYVYLPPKIYFYVIRYNEFRYDNVRYDNVTLDSNNQIEFMEYLYGQDL